MRRGTVSLVLLAALAAPHAGGAQAPTRAEYIEMTGRPKPTPQIPAALRSIVVEASPERLTVLGLDGRRIPIDIGWDEPERFLTFQDGRYLGFEFGGYENFGFTLVDRRADAASAVIETGAEPHFSPDGRHFAAVELSESAWGNLNGLALWRVEPDGTRQLFFTDALPRAFDWRIDGWTRPDCVALSAVSADWQPPTDSSGRVEDRDAELRRAPRLHFGLVTEPRIALHAHHGEPACVETPGSTDGATDG